MFGDLSKLAKAGADLLKANPDKIIEAIKMGTELVKDNKGENKGIVENARENLKEKSVSIVQEALNNISPLKIDIKGSITEKSVVITEESLNNYLKGKIADIEGLESINIKISDDNSLFITGEASKSLLKVTFSQKLKLEKFIINSAEGIAEFSLIGEPDIKAKGFMNQIVLFITRMILKSVVNKNLIEVMDENNIQLKENKLLIDLKNGPAKQFYEMDIDKILGKSIPFIGQKKIVDLIIIKNVKTKNSTILIDLGTNIF